MRIALGAAVAVVVVASVPRAARADEIVDIVVEDNTKTTSETVQLIADIDTGDEWTSSTASDAEQRLVTSGLFSSVRIYAEPVAGGQRVHLIVVDRFPWIVAPAVYLQPTNKGAGVGFGENNLFGKNQKLLVYAQAATGDSFFLGAFVDPSLFGTRLRAQLDTYLASKRTIEYAPPRAWLDDPRAVRTSRLHYLNGGARLGIHLWGKTTFDYRIRAAHVAYLDVALAEGARIEDVTGDPNATEIPAPGAAGWDISHELFYGFDTRANWYGLSSGTKLVMMYERALPSLGSDFRYWDMSVSGERAIRVLEHHNLVVKASLAYGHDLPFQQELTSGGTSMRGWKNAQFRGDLLATANAEYSVPLFTVKGLAVRGLGFWDTSYTTFVDGHAGDAFRDWLPGASPGLAPLKNSVGVGTRFYLRQVVLPLLGLDFGYGVERGDFEIYLAIGLTD